MTLPAAAIEALTRQALALPGAGCTVDLAAQRVTGPDGQAYGFDLDPGQRRLLLDGIDDIDLAWRRAAAIERFQTEQQAQRPWLA